MTNVMTFEILEKMAKEIFNLTLPTTLKELKDAFRREAKKLHPDVNGGNASHDNFIRIRESYILLLSMINSNIFINNNSLTTDGIALSELGRGLGSTKNGKGCNNCEGKGYNSRNKKIRKICNVCGGKKIIPVNHRCRLCTSTGIYVKRNGKKVVCLRCNGTGNFIHHIEKCFHCCGLGWNWEEDKIQQEHFICHKCNGKGEIPIYNPVLQKGALKIS